MRIWIIEIGEPLPLELGVRLHRYGEFSRFLAEQGHDVIWWSSSFSHTPKKHFATKDTEFFHGKALVKLLYGLGYKKNISLQRIRHQKHFAQKFLNLSVQEKKPDIILAPIPTIESVLAVNKYCQKNSVPYFVDIRDLWPDEFKCLAPRPLQFLARILLHPLYLKMKKVCSEAYGIIGISQSYLNYGLKFSGREIRQQDYFFPLSYMTQTISDENINQALAFWKKSGITNNSFIISFIGTIGVFHDLKTVLKVAEQLKDRSDICFVLAGDGNNLERYKKMAKKLPNVLFPGRINAAQIKTLLTQSSVALAPYKDGSFMSLPNKPFEYMAHGVPIISSIQGELKPYLKEYNAGLTYHTNDSETLKNHILFLYHNREAAKQKGIHAKKLFLKHFAASIVFQKAHHHLLNCFQKGFK